MCPRNTAKSMGVGVHMIAEYRCPPPGTLLARWFGSADAPFPTRFRSRRSPLVLFSRFVRSAETDCSILLVASFLLATSGTNHVAPLLFSPPVIDFIHGKLDVLGICADFLFARAALEQRVCCFWSYVVVDCDILVSKRHWRKNPPTASSSATREE